MFSKRIIVFIVSILLLCCCSFGVAFADPSSDFIVSEYSDTGGYDETPPGSRGDIGVMATSGFELFRLPWLPEQLYFSYDACPHCRSTMYSDNGYSRWACLTCGAMFIPSEGGCIRDFYHNYNKSTDTWYRTDVLIYRVLPASNSIYIYRYNSIIRKYFKGSGLNNFWVISEYSLSDTILGTHFSIPYSNDFLVDLEYLRMVYSLQLYTYEEWISMPTPTPGLTPFVPPYEAFATLEPVTIDNISDIVTDTKPIIKVVYDSLPHISVLLVIAIAISYIVIVLRG